jgi:hypothetical protein
MISRRRLAVAAVGFAALTAVLAAGAGSSPPGPGDFTNVPFANAKTPGVAPANALSPELADVVAAQGSMKIENGTATIPYYGYDGNGTMVPALGSNAEASKTEPDKNTYLVFERGLKGPDPTYNYGTHFLFQGHETGLQGYITRVNLDADPTHRITLVASQDAAGNPLPTFDGSTWDPWSQQLLFTTESSSKPGAFAVGADFPSTATSLAGSLGNAAYEGVQNDSDGNLWLEEDASGAAKKDAQGANTTAKRPNSFVYRFVPRSPGDLTSGKLEALQVLAADGHPITFDSQAALGSSDEAALHVYGSSFQTRWVVVHDTTSDGTAPFDVNAAAKAAKATPFKRPENGLFRPGSKFRELYFDETGDTNATSPENGCCGGWGSIFKLTQKDPSADTGTLSIFFNGNQAHAGFDNVAWFSKDKVAFVEDAGDTLHTQRNALDSAFMFDATEDYGNPANQPVRFIAEGRDPSATIDSGLQGTPGFQNEGDNEITGIHVSDGDPGIHGILGAKTPKQLGKGGWRGFWTQQHGDNYTWELIQAPDGN